MDDIISRQAAIRWVKTECNPYGKPTLDFESGKKVIEHLENMPPAQPRKKGKWEICNILDYAQRPTGRKFLRCPSCGYLTDEFRSRVDYYRMLTHFCPNCGVRLTEGEANE